MEIGKALKKLFTYQTPAFIHAEQTCFLLKADNNISELL